LVHGQIRKLTPLECERLQTLPDNYTKIDGMTDGNRIKAIGNGWTVDIIAHILSNIAIDKQIDVAI
jgi:DNA (cytosine-5)-methyltransferase 3A